MPGSTEAGMPDELLAHAEVNTSHIEQTIGFLFTICVDLSGQLDVFLS